MSREKHLEFTQGVINRMDDNSVKIKVWTVVLVCVLSVLASQDGKKKFTFVALIPIIGYWLLDSYYLYQKRLFIRMYDSVRKMTTKDYAMIPSQFDNGASDWGRAALSKESLLFYGVIAITLLSVTHYISK